MIVYELCDPLKRNASLGETCKSQEEIEAALEFSYILVM